MWAIFYSVPERSGPIYHISEFYQTLRHHIVVIMVPLHTDCNSIGPLISAMDFASFGALFTSSSAWAECIEACITLECIEACILACQTLLNVFQVVLIPGGGGNNGSAMVDHSHMRKHFGFLQRHRPLHCPPVRGW